MCYWVWLIMAKNLAESILALVPRRYPTKTALAKAAGITETSLYNILRTGTVSASTLAKLQRVGVRMTKKLINSLDSAA